MAWKKADYAYWARKWRKTKKGKAATKEQNRKGALRRYGLTNEAFEAILEVQGGVCAICRRPQTSKRSKHLFVDHEHVTGRVRGLLCGNCNCLLGYADDSLERLEHAKAYLEGR